MVLLQLGTNDLTRQGPLEVGSAIEDFVRLLYTSYRVKLVCVSQTIYRHRAPLFNSHVRTLTKYLKVVLEPLSYALFGDIEDSGIPPNTFISPMVYM